MIACDRCVYDICVKHRGVTGHRPLSRPHALRPLTPSILGSTQKQSIRHNQHCRIVHAPISRYTGKLKFPSSATGINFTNIARIAQKFGKIPAHTAACLETPQGHQSRHQRKNTCPLDHGKTSTLFLANALQKPQRRSEQCIHRGERHNVRHPDIPKTTHHHRILVADRSFVPSKTATSPTTAIT